jgi:salicylate hydroxylase
MNTANPSTIAAQRRAVIVGAGIGGLAAALALLQRGWMVQIYEQASRLGEVGAGLTISPNASRCLAALGLGEQLAAIGSIPSEGINFHYKTGEIVAKRRMGDDFLSKFGAPYYHLHRADLHQAMADLVEKRAPGSTHLGMAAKGVVNLPGAAMVTFATGEQAHGDLVIGADGVRSVLHDALFGASEPTFTHRVAWRAVLPNAVLDGIDMPGRMFSARGPDRTFAAYRMRQDQLLNVVFLSRWDEWVDEDWRSRCSVEGVREAFEGWNNLTQQIIDRLPEEGPLQWGLFDRPPHEQWVSGRVAFVGDAAHPMLPYMGQGAAMSIEDAVILARALDEIDDMDEALAAYARTRQPRTGLIQLASRERADQWEKGDPDKPAVNTAVWDPDQVIYPYDATTEALVV